ncbi:UDP-2,4-diacetamido-2,4,6-trideoxy-beta-L-altropyranose hydrolase [bacterium]|nr:UDP-2,4-diacetamido-2,4,6-trideoxy-beta-L-altropyranose hydrolase [bacterium]
MQTNTRNLYIRADATSTLGLGHIMRCIALAQTWRNLGGRVIFLSHCASGSLLRLIKEEGFEYVPIDKPHPDLSDLQTVLQLLKCTMQDAEYTSPKSDWKDNDHAPNSVFVLDGYHFTTNYQKAIREHGFMLLVIDDMAHLDHYQADILVNQNIHARDLDYSLDKGTLILLGCEYCMLRREFMDYKNWKRHIPEKAKKILVTFGGSDPHNVTLKVIDALNYMKDTDLEVKIIVGSLNPHMATLQESAARLPFTVQILSSVNNIAQLMAWADLAVSAGGSTCWEMAFMGLPNSIVLVAENQRGIAEWLEAKGAALKLGWWDEPIYDQAVETLEKLMNDQDTRRQMSERGQNLVDGRGNDRVIDSMVHDYITLSAVQEGDCKLIWDWANDPEVRNVSFSSQSIPWDNHVQWFNAKLNDPDCLFYIAYNGFGTPVGQVRFDNNGRESVISISIDKKFRGRGYGKMMIEVGARDLFKVSDALTIHAYIKQDNGASKRVFMKAGFHDSEMKNINGQQAIHLILTRDDLM